MSRLSVKKKLEQGELLISAMVRFPDPSAAEVLALCGVDIVTVDMEHYPFNEETILHVIRAVQSQGGACFVRVPDADPERIGRMMDYGADGIHLPGVETCEEAEQLVQAVKSPPVGRRGFCPITRAARYGLDGANYQQYARRANDEALIMIQVETKTGVENVDEIAAVDGIDLVGHGPSDLAASYRVTGQNDHPLVQAATEKIYAAVQKNGKCMCDIASTPAQIKELRKKGARCIGIGSDQQLMAAACRALVKEIHKEA